MWLVPGPFDYSRNQQVALPIVLNGTHSVDTSFIPYPVYISSDSVSTTQSISTPSMVELVTDKEETNAHIYIRTTAYPFIQGDSLRLEMFHEYNIQPRGLEIIKVDSIPYLVEVPVPVEVPFIEKPYVVAPIAVAITLGIVYITGQALK